MAYFVKHLSIRSVTVILHVTYPKRLRRWENAFILSIWSADRNPPRQVGQKECVKQCLCSATQLTVDSADVISLAGTFAVHTQDTIYCMCKTITRVTL